MPARRERSTRYRGRRRKASGYLTDGQVGAVRNMMAKVEAKRAERAFA